MRTSKRAPEPALVFTPPSLRLPHADLPQLGFHQGAAGVAEALERDRNGDATLHPKLESPTNRQLPGGQPARAQALDDGYLRRSNWHRRQFWGVIWGCTIAT